MKRSQKMFAVLFLGSSLAGAGAAFAAPPPGVPTVRASTVKASEVRDELWDLKKLERLQDRFALARSRNDRGILKQVEAELRQFLDSELREARADVREAKFDARRGERLARREVREESRSLARIRAIDRELDSLYRRFDRRSMAKKSELIRELVKLAKAEVADARSDRRIARR